MKIWLRYGSVVIIFSAGALVLAAFSFGSKSDSAALEGSKCTSVAAVRVVTISDRGFSPSDLTVKRCTELIFVSVDKSLHNPAFGQHDHHDHTLPFEERVLSLGQTNSVVFDKAGSHSFHDHLNDELTGQVTVQ